MSGSHFKIRTDQRPEGLESPKDAVVAHSVTLIGDERLVVGSRLGFDLGSFGMGIPTVIANDLQSDPVVGGFFQNVVQLGRVENDVDDIILQ